MAISSSSGSFSFAAGEQHFIPEIFSKKLQAKFYKQTVLAEVTNNDYEGEISGQGDKVNIRTVPAVSVAPEVCRTHEQWSEVYGSVQIGCTERPMSYSGEPPQYRCCR